MNISNMNQMSKKMNEISEAIELFNEGKLDLYDDELIELIEEREELIQDYYKNYAPKNVIPLIHKFRTSL